MMLSRRGEGLRAVLGNLIGHDSTTALEPVTAERVTATLRAGRALAVVGAIVLLLAHFTNAFLLDHEVDAFDANYEGTPLTWASGVATAAVAVAAFVAAIMTGPRVPLVVLGLTTAFLSMDDMIAVHERIAGMLLTTLGVSDTWDSVVWPVLYLPLLAVTAMLILRMTRAGTPETFRHAVLGLGLLLVAVVLEVVTAPWSSGTNLVHTVQGGVEEALELAGWVYIASGAVTTMLANVVRQATAGSHR